MEDITPKYKYISARDKIVSDVENGEMAEKIGGLTVDAQQLSQGGIQIQGVAERILIGSATDPMIGVGIFIGNDGALLKGYDFRVGDPSGNYIYWDASAATLTVAGVFTAGSLNIPDSTTANSFHVDSTGNAWWGTNIATGHATAPAKILNTGAATFSSVIITGGTIGGSSVIDVGYISDTTANAVPSDLTASATAITTATDGTISSNVTLTWTAISANTFDHYQIRYKKASYTYYLYIDSKTNTITIDGLVPNVSYNFGIASVNKNGIASAFSSDISQTTATSTTAPATVANTSANAGIQYSLITWNSNTEADLASYNVYRHTSNNSGASTLIGNVRTNYFIDGNRTGGTILYYWVKAVNTSGLVSASYSTVTSCTPRNAASTDIQDGAVTSVKANLATRGWIQTSAFTVTDADTVAWGIGTFTASDGTSYSISAGNTGNMAAKTYIYLDIATSTTAYQITTTATTAIGDGKVLVAIAQNGTAEATFLLLNNNSYNIDAANIVAGSITSNEIKTGTITATQIDTTSITSLSNLAIGASQVLIDGVVYLSNWQKSGDLTKIDGGSISANTITTTQLNFTPVQGSNVIASINASAEGITIDADNLTISAATTFSSGYDPTTKTAKVGGTYDSAASGARVRIFPDANTGIQIIDNGGADVFKCLVGGTNVGDVSIGNYGGSQGMYYDKSAGTFDFKGAMSAGSININGGVAEILSTGAATFKSIQVGGSTRQYTLTDSGIFSFGDGSDGDHTTSGNETLTEDKYYQNLTVATGHTLNPAGYRIFVQDTLTLAGTGKIARNGQNGTDASTTVRGDGGLLADGYLKGSAQAGNGANGNSSGQVGTAGDNGINVTNCINSSGGGNGGRGADSSSGGVPPIGGNGGTAGSTTVSNVKLIANWHLATMLDVSTTGSTIKFNSSGTAGGGGSGGDSGSGGDYSGGGGGGGSNGGLICIYAKKIVIGASASITANGGNGGNGAAGTGSAGGGGGGGGGAGGIIVLVYNILTNSGTGNITVDGGTGGTKGANGNNGTNGSDGSTGLIYYFQLSI